MALEFQLGADVVQTTISREVSDLIALGAVAAVRIFGATSLELQEQSNYRLGNNLFVETRLACNLLKELLCCIKILAEKSESKHDSDRPLNSLKSVQELGLKSVHSMAKLRAVLIAKKLCREDTHACRNEARATKLVERCKMQSQLLREALACGERGAEGGRGAAT